MIVNAHVPAGTFGTGSDRDQHDDSTVRQLETTLTGRTFIWYYGAPLSVRPVERDDDLDMGPDWIYPAYLVTGRLA